MEAARRLLQLSISQSGASSRAAAVALFNLGVLSERSPTPDYSAVFPYGITY